MAFSRPRYETCAYKQFLAESIGELGYVLDPVKFYHSSPARIEKGIVAGNDVSIARSGNLVDVESDLLGIDRKLSRCETLKYQNPCPNGTMNSCHPRQLIIRGNPSNSARVIDIAPVHLPSAQMFRYTPIPLPPTIYAPRC